MNSNSKKYFVIFDTNIMYKTYHKEADFREFSLNSTFNNVVEMINQLDIYEQVEILISTVVWNELERQIIEAHEKQIAEVEKWKFPEYVIRKTDIEDYQKYIHEKIVEYRECIESGINKIRELPLPSDNCFGRIITRSFEKRAPFEGKEKNSDKGFKDVLIWESILELTEKNSEANIIFYSHDKVFKDKLVEEFSSLYPNAHISICVNQDEVKDKLESWAKDIDDYAFVPLQICEDDIEFNKWIRSSDFQDQIKGRYFGSIGKNDIIHDTFVDILGYRDVEKQQEREDSTRYSFNVSLSITYEFIYGNMIEEKIEAHVEVRWILNEVFVVEDIYRIDEEKQEVEN